MQLKYGSQNLMLWKNRIRFTDKKYFALDLPIKNINALETTMGARRITKDRRVCGKEIFMMLWVFVVSNALIFFIGTSKGIVFFFPRKSLRVTHSLDFRSGPEKKKTSCFFFPAQNFRFFAVFFFLRKSLHCTHSLKIRGRKKKKQPRKKKKQLFYSLTRILSENGQKQTFPGKKIRYLCTTRLKIFLDAKKKSVTVPGSWRYPNENLLQYDLRPT